MDMFKQKSKHFSSINIKLISKVCKLEIFGGKVVHKFGRSVGITLKERDTNHDRENKHNNSSGGKV
jgi:hypothetical protein